MLHFSKKIKLMKDEYLAYLKKVATKLGKNGEAEATTIKAFIKKI
ncbi:MAG: hypothetical protein QXF25_03320 [Candidatus Pacearchaeota archaeon]